MPVELRQPILVLLLQQPMSNLLLAVQCGGAVFDQRVARHLQLLKGALHRRRCLGEPQVQRCSHLRQHPRVHRVGLCPLADGLRKAPRLQRVDTHQRQPGLEQRFLEGAVPPSGRLVRDAANRQLDPRDQRLETRRVIGEPRGLAGGNHVNVEMRFRDVNAYGKIGHLFLLLCLSCEPSRSRIHSGRRKRRWRPNCATAPRRPAEDTVRPPPARRRFTRGAAGLGPSQGPFLANRKQTSAGPAKRVDGRDRPCVVNALRAQRGPYPVAPPTGLNPPTPLSGEPQFCPQILRKTQINALFAQSEARTTVAQNKRQGARLPTPAQGHGGNMENTRSYRGCSSKDVL